MRVLITRPTEDGEPLGRLLAAGGHQPVLAPLLQTRFFEGPPLMLDGVAAILATSANGVRALSRRTPRRDLTILAVGPQTTQEARAAGFTRVENADGDARVLAQAVARWIARQDGALLHVCGSETAGGLAEALTAQGYVVRREILYAVDALPLPKDAAAALRDGRIDAALFFSPRSARIFAEAAAGLPLSHVMGCCISPATAAALPPQLFGEIRIAAKPNQDALLALIPAPR